MENGLISYYNTPRKYWVRQLRLIVVPIKFRRVVNKACLVSLLEGHSHEQRILSSVLARFWWPMVNTEVAQFIRAYAHCQLVN